MLFPRSSEGLYHVVDLYQGFQVELPYFATPAIAPHTAVRLLPCVQADVDGRRLYFNPNTATWCLLDSDEVRIADSLAEPARFSELMAKTKLATGRLRTLITHLYRLGLAEVGGKAGLDQAVYARGPLFGKRYNIELVTTERCDLACAYCFANARAEGQQMDLETGFGAIDRTLEFEASSVWLKFDGGETLLDFDHFRWLVTYARDRERGMGRQLGVGIQLTTNGTALDAEQADFLAEQGVRVHLSLDGPEEIHDQVRRFPGGEGSYRRAARALGLLQERGVECLVIGVVGRHNSRRAAEVVEHLVNLGVESVRLNPVYLTGRGRDSSIAVSAEDYFGFLSEVLDLVASTRALREENLAAMGRNLVVPTRDYRCMRSPCGAGYDHLAIDPAGDIYPCGAYRLSVPESRMGRLSDIARLEDAFLGNALVEQMASRIVADIPECAECDWRHLCEGGCSLDAHLNQGGLMRPCSLCSFYRRMYPRLLRVLAARPAALSLLVPEALWCHA